MRLDNKWVKLIVLGIILGIFILVFFIARAIIRNVSVPTDVIPKESEKIIETEFQTETELSSGIHYITPDGVDESYGYADSIVKWETSIGDSYNCLNKLGSRVGILTVKQIYEDALDILDNMIYDSDIDKNGALYKIDHFMDISEEDLPQEGIIIVENAAKVVGMLNDNTILLTKINETNDYNGEVLFCIDCAPKMFAKRSMQKLDLGDWFSFSYDAKNCRKVKYDDATVYYIVGGVN